MIFFIGVNPTFCVRVFVFKFHIRKYSILSGNCFVIVKVASYLHSCKIGYVTPVFCFGRLYYITHD
jgi:hypothetical protein